MIGMHIIFLRTDGLNKALCQSATSLFIVVGRGSVVSENMLFWKKKRFLIAPAGINLAYIKCERRVTSVFCRLPPTQDCFVIYLRKMAIVQLCRLGRGATCEGEVLTPQLRVSGASPVSQG